MGLTLLISLIVAGFFCLGAPVHSGTALSAQGACLDTPNIEGPLLRAEINYQGLDHIPSPISSGTGYAYSMLDDESKERDVIRRRQQEGLKIEPLGKTTVLPGSMAFTNSIGMKFVLIPSSSFMMGSPPDDKSRLKHEIRHRVLISKPFFFQSTEVTQGQWKIVMGNNPSYFKDCGDECPVESVSWYDAQEFIKWLNQMEGTDRYRLPTEAEWEHACRANTSTRFWTGACISTEQANYNGNYPLSGCPEGVYRKRTIKSGSFSPNPWGLYDIHGNVWEWCQDWYGKYPNSHVKDPSGPFEGRYRIVRGGSWYSKARYVRSSNRNVFKPRHSNYLIGFRVVRDF